MEPQDAPNLYKEWCVHINNWL